MQYILFDSTQARMGLLPLTYTRPVAECRIGIDTIREKWEHYLQQPCVMLTEDYLHAKHSRHSPAGAGLLIDGSIIPDAALVKAILSLPPDTSLHLDGLPIAYHLSTIDIVSYEQIPTIITTIVTGYTTPVIQIKCPADIFRHNAGVLQADFARITHGRMSQPLPSSNTLIGEEAQLFIEEGASIEAATLNTRTGPIYIGRDAEVMEGSLIRGPFALCDHAGTKMAAKIYGATTIGPHCKVGGEVSNTVFFGYSNKGHDGFIGNSVVGEWCNLGADTNTSNLKNNYGNVDVWSYTVERSVDTGLQFHGLVMGDHAKTGINTMFNTGTVVGVSANVFGSDFPPKFIPSFTWGGAQWLRTFTFDKSLEVAERMMQRRSIPLTEADISILREVYHRDEKYRKK
jgi:UDP-N-acetylglucosamine diphosphorylase/glucosamine-1-phosphate N-acetyltransferase